MELRDYQIELSDKGCEILTKHGLVYFSMEVRTGKTLTALQTANKYTCNKVLFVTKKKAISSITNDYNLLSPDYQIAIVNYESLHKVNLKDYDLFILDEAHSMGAFPKPSKRVKELGYITKPVIYLSGTPSPESWSQLYHQFYPSANSPFKEHKTFYKWANNYVNKKQRVINSNTINDYSDAKIEIIKRKTDHLFLSYTQKQAGFNQTINENTLIVDMPNNCKFLIDKLKKELVIQGDEEVILADTPVKLMQKVHQLSSGTVKFESGNTMTFSTFKADYIKHYFKGQKIAIFYKFKAEFECLKSVFSDWTNDIEEFNTSNKVFLSQIVSGREGINLSIADSLIFYNIDFSATSYLQARDRLTSKTRTKENKVYWVFSDYGIEKDIYKAVIKKEDYTLKHFRK